MEGIKWIRKRVKQCETEGVAILCCPEAVLGGLADYAARPADFAIDVEGGHLEAVLAPLASNTVSTIIGFTEIPAAGRLYNSAAVFQNGAVVGFYRKLHPAINKSVYEAGDQIPVFTVSGLTFGILICNGSNFPELAGSMAAKGQRHCSSLPTTVFPQAGPERSSFLKRGARMLRGPWTTPYRLVGRT